jgi:hypothetical protein
MSYIINATGNPKPSEPNLKTFTLIVDSDVDVPPGGTCKIEVRPFVFLRIDKISVPKDIGEFFSLMLEHKYPEIHGADGQEFVSIARSEIAFASFKHFASFKNSEVLKTAPPHVTTVFHIYNTGNEPHRFTATATGLSLDDWGAIE